MADQENPIVQFDHYDKISDWSFMGLLDSLKSRLRIICSRVGYAIYHFSVRLSMGGFKHSKLVPHRLKHPFAKTLGDFGFLILDLLKKSVWRMSAAGQTVLYVGFRESFLRIVPLLFDGSPTYQQIGEISSLTLSRQTMKWLHEGCDMVICELSRLHPYRSRAPITFTMPQWVNLLVEYPDQIDTLLAGNRRRNLRNQINKCRKAGCQWRFSQSREDYDFFYERLYVPFVRSRHGDHAHIAQYPYHWDMWIKGAGGGLVLVTQKDKIVAGSVCLVVDDICYELEMGVLDADEALFKQGINGYLSWSTLKWGKTQGARFYNIGGTLGVRSDGAFRWKSRWGSRVIRRAYTCPLLTFSANRISPSLRDRINALGFICERNDCHFSLIIDKTDSQLPAGELAPTIEHARNEGLQGLCVIAPESPPSFYPEYKGAAGRLRLSK
jgi:hypothetical protein